MFQFAHVGFYFHEFDVRSPIGARNVTVMYNPPVIALYVQ
jgi:hypothetical protein